MNTGTTSMNTGTTGMNTGTNGMNTGHGTNGMNTHMHGEKNALGGGTYAGGPGGGNVNASGRRSRFGNPAPLGLISFASTLFLLSLVNVRARGVFQTNIIIGMGLAFGGLCQLLAGMWEFAAGNTLGATVFTSYGGFWLSLSLIFIPGTGVLSSLGADFNDALALYLATWFIFTFLMFIGSLRSTLGLVAFFFTLDMTFLFLMLGQIFPTKFGLTKTGGAFGIIASFIAYYVGTSELIPRHASYFTLPTYQLPRRDV